MNKNSPIDSFLYFFIFSFFGILAFFFANNQSSVEISSLLGQVAGSVGNVRKSDYSVVYNCSDQNTYLNTAGRRMGYGFGLKANSNSVQKRDGFGYGYCMNFVSNPIVLECLIPKYKKVYECERSGCGSPPLTAISGIGYGYGFSKDAVMAGVQNGFGYGKCRSYKPLNFYPDFTSYYFYKAASCQAGIK